MAAQIRTWDESAPTDGANPKDGARVFREDIKNSIREKMNEGDVYWPNTASADQDAGKRITGINTADQAVLLFESDKTTAMLTGDDSANSFDFAANAITTTGAITGAAITGTTIDGTTITASVAFAGPKVTSGNNPGHAHDSTLHFNFPSDGLSNDVGLINGIYFENLGNGSLTLLEIVLIMGFVSGATNTFDIVKQASGWTDPLAGSTSIITGGAQTLTAGTERYTFIDFADAVLADGDLWGIEFPVVDGASSLRNGQVMLKVRRS